MNDLKNLFKLQRENQFEVIHDSDSKINFYGFLKCDVNFKINFQIHKWPDFNLNSRAYTLAWLRL